MTGPGDLDIESFEWFKASSLKVQQNFKSSTSPFPQLTVALSAFIALQPSLAQAVAGADSEESRPAPAAAGPKFPTILSERAAPSCQNSQWIWTSLSSLSSTGFLSHTYYTWYQRLGSEFNAELTSTWLGRAQDGCPIRGWGLGGLGAALGPQMRSAPWSLHPKPC